MEHIIPLPGENLLELAKRCGALYICPKLNGVRQGPVVPYAGKDAQGRNLVGDIYFNFRRIERHPAAVEAFAKAVVFKLLKSGLIDSFDTICGIPNGGRTFGQSLATLADKSFVYPDKKPRPTELGKKQEYDWDLSQFDFEEGERVAIAEDIFNNFQNTDNTLEQIAASGATITLLVGALNRSPIYESEYVPKSGPFAGHSFPIIASIREAYPEYEQDDSAVRDDIAAGNIELEVKNNWGRLCEIMRSASV